VVFLKTSESNAKGIERRGDAGRRGRWRRHRKVGGEVQRYVLALVLTAEEGCHLPARDGD